MDKIENIEIKTLIQEAERTEKCAQLNLKNLESVAEFPDESQEYFMGLIRRQALLCHDLAVLLKFSKTNNLTGPLIICRALMDDFLHSFFLVLDPDTTENVIRINAESHREIFRGFEDLTGSNYRHFKGKYEFYMDGKQLNDLRTTFNNKPENAKYFINKNFKDGFKTKELVDGVKDFELNKLAHRAFFIWKQFSMLAHYSNPTYRLESSPKEQPIFWLEIEETLLYSFNTIRFCMIQLNKTLKVDFNDNGLSDKNIDLGKQ